MDNMHFGLSLLKTELSYTRVFEILVSDYYFFCKNICNLFTSQMGVTQDCDDTGSSDSVASGLSDVIVVFWRSRMFVD